MHASYDSVDSFSTCQRSDVVERIDDSGMGTTQQDDEAGVGFYPARLPRESARQWCRRLK